MNRQKIQIIPLFVFLMIISVSLLLMDRNRITDPVRSTIEYYVLKIKGAHISDNVNVDELKSKISSLVHEKENLEDENRTLRKQLQAPLPKEYAFIPSVVLSRKIDEKQSELFIAVGTEDGVDIGMPVVAEQILVGVVASVTPRTAHVQLLSDPESKIAVRSGANARGIVFGSNENKANLVYLDRVLQSETIDVDDSVETSGEDEHPRGLLIGKIIELTTESRDPFQKAVIELSIDPTILERVFVVDAKE